MARVVSRRRVALCPYCCGRIGHTLVELMVALPLTVAILAASGGLVLAVSKSQALANGLMADRIVSLEAAQTILSDVQFASSLADFSLHSIEFSAQDRNGDHVEDSIKYSWAGVAGDPLQYSVNGSSPETLVDNVHHFELKYSRVYDHTETLLHHHDDSPAGQFSNWAVDKNRSASQFLVPQLHAASTKWTLNRVRIRARSVGVADGKIDVSIVKPDNQLPSDSVYEVVQFDEAELDSEFAWFDVYFSRVSNLSAATSICIVVSTEDAGTDSAAEICYESIGTAMPDDTSLAVSTDGEASWSAPDSSSDMRFYAIGTHDYVNASRSVIQNVQLAIGVGNDLNTRALSTVRLLNEPETDPVVLASSYDSQLGEPPEGTQEVPEAGSDVGSEVGAF